MTKPCRNAAVNVWLNGIVENIIRPLIPIDTIQRFQVFQLRERIHAGTSHFNRNVTNVGTLGNIVAGLWGNQDNFKAVLGVTVDDVAAEIDEVAEAVVGEKDFMHCNSLFIYTPIYTEHDKGISQITNQIIWMIVLENISLSIKGIK